MIKAWWFAQADMRLPHGDGRRVRKGGTHKHKGPLKLCSSGLHASTNIMDALGYAQSPILCRVECAGEIIHGDNKLVCRERKYLHIVNVERELHLFAIWCAERALKQAKVTDERSWNALKVKRLWLDGKATDAELSAAYTAARAAAYTAAAYTAAYSAAYTAADSAAYSAADSAAYLAACSAACSAAYLAACSAACSAAYSAACSAERKIQARKLQSMFSAKIRSGK